MKSEIYRKDLILEYLKLHTQELLDGGKQEDLGFTAQDLADTLGLARSNVSRDLNTLYRQGQVLKFLGKPTRYLHYFVAAEHYDDAHIPITVPANKNLQDYVNGTPMLEESIAPVVVQSHPTLASSMDFSLREAAAQAESAIRYPPNGLHILIEGEVGTGKQPFVEHIFEYSKAIGQIPKQAKLYTFDCRAFSSIKQSASIALFGCVEGALSAGSPSRKGLIERANGSILVLEEIHTLSAAVQEKLAMLLFHGYYARIGESSARHQSNLMVIATTTQINAQGSHIAPYFPVKIQLPPLRERTILELFVLMCRAFRLEAKGLNCAFSFSRDICYLLLCNVFSYNLVSLQNHVKRICALALIEHSQATQGRGSSAFVVPVEHRHLSSALHSPLSDDPDKTQAILAFLQNYPYEEIIIKPTSDFSEYLPASPTTSTVVDFAKLNETEAGEPVAKAYVREYLRTVAQLDASQKNVYPVVTSCVYRAMRQDPILCKLEPDNPLLQCLVELLANPSVMDSKWFTAMDTFGMESASYEEVSAVMNQLKQNLSNLSEGDYQPHFLRFVASCLHTIRIMSVTPPVMIFLVFPGKHVSEGLADYFNDIYGSDVTALSFSSKEIFSDILAQIDEVLRGALPNSQVLFLTHGMPYHTLHLYAQERYHVSAKTLSNITIHAMCQVVQSITAFYFDLDMLEYTSADTLAEESSLALTPLVRQAVFGILQHDLIFLDLEKTLPTLIQSLTDILSQLQLAYSDDIAIKFYFHCGHMLERIIGKEPLDFLHLKAYTKTHERYLTAIGRATQILSESMGIKIPTCELAYLCEIFTNENSGLDK